jgi:hypothetical protein
VLESLWSLSYLSTKYSKIARVSLDLGQQSVGGGDHSEHLPNDEVVIVMVDDSRDAAVGVELQVFWALVLLLAKIEVHSLICQPELFKDDGGFPKGWIGSDAHSVRGGGGSEHTSHWVHQHGRTR